MKVYDHGGVEIWHGDCVEELRELPDKSVQVCVTSPPYWGLRNYGDEGVWFGGDVDCDHVPAEYETSHVSGQVSTVKRLHGNAGRARGKYLDADDVGNPVVADCSVCGAWRGQLGQEPTVGDYVDNLVAVFREVRRVLRDDGVLWLNLGDSYNNAANSHQNGLGKSTLKGRADASVKGGVGLSRDLVPGLAPKNLVGVPWRVAFRGVWPGLSRTACRSR